MILTDSLHVASALPATAATNGLHLGPRRARAPWLALLATLLLASVSSAQQDKLFDRAKALRKSGQAGAAADLLGPAVESPDCDERLAGLCGLCLLDDGRLPEARALAASFAHYAGREPRIHTLLGRLAQTDGDTEAASAAFHAAIAHEPAFVEAAVCLIRLEMSAGQFGMAADEAERLEAYQPDLGRALGAEALQAQAEQLRHAGKEQIGRVIEKYEAELQKRPGDRAVVHSLLDVLILAIRIDRARALMATEFTGEKDEVERHYYEGRCRDALADPDGAVAEYRAALAVDAGHVPSLLELARLAIDDGRYDEALSQLALATSAGSVTVRSSLLVGLAEEGLGHDAPAEAAWRQALSLDAGNAKALYLLGRLLVRTGRTSEGEALLAKVNTGSN